MQIILSGKEVQEVLVDYIQEKIQVYNHESVKIMGITQQGYSFDFSKSKIEFTFNEEK